MKAKPLPEPFLLRSLLHYNPESGVLTWKPRDKKIVYAIGGCVEPHRIKRWNLMFAGNRAGSLVPTGYIVLRIAGVSYFAHRIIYAMYYDDIMCDASLQIDHIDGNRANNCISNLRLVSMTENNRNKAVSVRNKSGVAGVFWYAKRKKWRAVLGWGETAKFLGYFSNFDDAVDARLEAEAMAGYIINQRRAQSA